MISKLRPPKLTCLKYASRLQTVDLLHSGWRGVALQRHLNEGAAGNVILNDYILTGFYYVRRSQYTRSTPASRKRSTCYMRGGEVLPIKGHRPRACGWEGNLPQSLNRRSGARHQPLPYWQFLDRTLYTITHTSAPVFVVGARPVLGARFTRYPSGGCFDCATLRST